MTVTKMLSHPVRIGEKIDFGDGFIWDIADVCWILDENLVDPHGAAISKLNVRIN